jgi:poly(3-hydroxybutyrate) depolymerase
VAAHERCGSVPPFRRTHHVQTGVGHCGVFNGRRWESSICPIVRDFVFAHG